MKSCIYCGRDNEDAVVVCSGCGTNEFKVAPPVAALGTPTVLPVQPQFTSATPLMAFRGQRYEGVLLTHIQSGGPVQFDSLFMVNEIGRPDWALIVALESPVPGQPLTLAIYGTNGRHILPAKAEMEYGREKFLSYALFIIDHSLRDRLVFHVPPEAQAVVHEKCLKVFYPDAAQRQKLHYTFAHRFLPAYALSDPARLFGYFERGEGAPTQFIKARWWMMEKELGLLEQSTSAPPVIRLVADLQMWVQLPGPPPLPRNVSTAPRETSSEISFGGKYRCAVVRMPTPEFMTHAYFVGIIMEPGTLSGDTARDASVRVFTLEKIENAVETGHLCEWSIVPGEVRHRNHGTAVPVTREDFVAAMVEKMETRDSGAFVGVTIHTASP